MKVHDTGADPGGRVGLPKCHSLTSPGVPIAASDAHFPAAPCSTSPAIVSKTFRGIGKMLSGGLAALAVSVWPAGHAATAEPPFCSTLGEVVRVAEARDGFSDISGADAGLYRESTVLPAGADFCVILSDDCSSASWRCLMASANKYTLALQRHGKLVSRVKECLGEAWSVKTQEDEDYFKRVVFTSPTSASRVEVMVTNPVRSVHGWKPRRNVLAVVSPLRDDETRR